MQKNYQSSEVVFVGIHTPETQGERSIGALKKKLAEAGLTHPVLVDNDMDNWKLYGNQYWPSIYLIDKKGIARYRWDGEVQDAGGKIMHEKIKLLMGEK